MLSAAAASSMMVVPLLLLSLHVARCMLSDVDHFRFALQALPLKTDRCSAVS
jgi:hypothetical protein